MKRIYETFPVISTIEVFVATNCQEDFRQKETNKQTSKQHLVAHNISSIF